MPDLTTLAPNSIPALFCCFYVQEKWIFFRFESVLFFFPHWQPLSFAWSSKSLRRVITTKVYSDFYPNTPLLDRGNAASLTSLLPGVLSWAACTFVKSTCVFHSRSCCEPDYCLHPWTSCASLTFVSGCVSHTELCWDKSACSLWRFKPFIEFIDPLHYFTLAQFKSPEERIFIPISWVS